MGVLVEFVSGFRVSGFRDGGMGFMGLGFVTVHGLVAVLGPINVLRLASQLAKMCSGLLHLDFWKGVTL